MRAARPILYCTALLGVFVIENPQCGSYRVSHTHLAQLYLHDGLYDQALAETRRAIRQEGPSAQRLLIASLAHIGIDQVDNALELLGQAIDLEPNNSDLYALVRDICQREERFATMEEILAHLRLKHPENAWLWATQGWLFAHQQRPEEAIDALRKAINLDADHLFAHIELSRLLIAKEHFAEAEATLIAALSSQPDDPQLLLVLGNCQLRQGLYAQADSTFEKALATKAIGAVDIARIYYQNRQADRTIEYYERALTRNPDDPLILNNLAWTYAEAGLRLHYALDLSIRAIKLEATSPVYLDTYAELLLLTGRPSHAIAVMGQALALEPADGEHRIYLEGQMAKFRQALAEHQ